MILSRMAPSCLHMSSYRAIWTHFTSNSMILVQKYTVLGPGPGPVFGPGPGLGPAGRGQAGRRVAQDHS